MCVLSAHIVYLTVYMAVCMCVCVCVSVCVRVWCATVVLGRRQQVLRGVEQRSDEGDFGLGDVHATPLAVQGQKPVFVFTIFVLQKHQTLCRCLLRLGFSV